ncbi:MAG: 4-alpha-glucanotransferase [Treponemataceae bacterium]|nr:4-alpha-glucanotransferase [Treponemataceae bacterium]
MVDQNKPRLGIAVPVGALRTADNEGVGDFLSLIPLGNWCASLGITLIQLLPVNDTGFQSSPYSALTAYGLHPLYLRLSAIPEASRYTKEIRALKEKYDSQHRFLYGAVQDAKIALLRTIYSDEKEGIQKRSVAGGDIGEWITTNPWVIEYALFRSLKDRHGGRHWKEWPEFQQVEKEALLSLWENPAYREEALFWVWVQFNLDKQFREAARAVRNLGIMLKGDLPILLNEDSCDVWAHPEYFFRELSAGAPPMPMEPAGQNWGFPVYNWEHHAREGFRWWKERVRHASTYYDAYRLDHVLGFFRLWATSVFDETAALGRFLPSEPIFRTELEQRGFDGGRIRWLSEPHVPTQELRNAVGDLPQAEAEVRKVCALALEQIGQEPLWLFKKTIRGERDLKNLDINESLRAYLLGAWKNRTLLEYEPGVFVPTWTYWDTRAFTSLSDEERWKLDTLIQEKRRASEKLWERQGRSILSALREASAMVICAEDLGAIPDCVPVVLEELGILGLKIVRWTRKWNEWGEPYIPFEQYPERAVCTPAVHDTSTLRQWWETEADREAFKQMLKSPGVPDTYTPEVAFAILRACAASPARFVIFQIQDLLHLSGRWYTKDPGEERINIPGTVSSFNWTYRLPVPIEVLAEDAVLSEAVRALAEIRDSRFLNKK